MKKLSVLLASAPALLAGVALAGPPTGFGGYGNFGATDGTVQFDYGAGAICPAGYTCSTLAATGTGISQRKVTLVDRVAAGIEDGGGNLISGATDIAEGTAFIHTIVVEDDETIAIGNNLNTIGFLAESFVGAQNNSNTIATVGTVDLSDGTGTGRVTADLSRGFLLQDDEPTDIRVFQTQTFPGITVNFTFLDNGPASKFQRIDQLGGAGAANGGSMTIRVSSGEYTCVGGAPNPNAPGVCGDGVIEMPDGNDIAYNAGDALQMVFMRLQNFGVGAATDRVLEVQSVRTAGTQNTLYAAPAQTWTSHTGAGVFNAVDPAAGAGSTWQFWDGNFGAAPTFTGVGGSGVSAFP